MSLAWGRRYQLTACLFLLLLPVSGIADEAEQESEPTTEESLPAEEDETACWRLNRWLVGDCLTERTGFHVEGWLEQGFTWNPASPTDRFNGPVTQNDRANEYQLNQLYLIAARAVDAGGDKLDFGFQADMLYGTDAAFFQALGLDDKIVSDSASRFYKLAIPQLYAEVYAPIGSGVTFQIGKWYTPVGYETGLATQDFFYSKTIGFVPVQYTHTGVLATWNVTDQLETSHGFHRGSDVWEDNNNALAYTGAFAWTSQDEETVLNFAISLGPEQDERADFQDLDGAPGPDAPGESLNRVTLYVALERQLTERLQYVLVHDYFFQDGSATFGIERAEAYGFTQYLIFQYNDDLAAGLRLEIYRDDDGFVSGCRSENPAAPSLYTNLTLGLNYQARQCLVIRPEVRWDWQDRDRVTDIPAFNAGMSTSQFLFAVDAVLRF